MLKIRCFSIATLLFCSVLAAQGNHYSLGLADGDGQITRIHAVNPSTTDTITVILKPYHGDGSDNPAIMGTNAFTLTLPPLASASVATAEIGPGANAGFMTIEAFGEMVGWTEESGRDGGGAEVMRNTSLLVSSEDLGDSYLFPSVAVQGADQALPDTMLPGDAILSEAWLGVRNTRNFTATILVESGDAVTGAPSESITIDIPPDGGIVAPVSELAGSLLTGHARIRTRVLSGEAFPYVSYEGSDAKAKNIGQTLVSARQGNHGPRLSYLHSESNAIEGYYAVTESSNGPIAGDATLTSALDGAMVTHHFGNNANNSSSYVASAQLLDGGLDEELGDVTVNLMQGNETLTTGFLFNQNARATVTPTKPIHRALLPFDAGRDWKTSFADSELVVYLDHPEPVTLVVTGLDADGHYTRFAQHELTPGANAISVTQILGGDETTVNLLLELANDQARVFPDLLVVGYDHGNAIMDRVQAAPLAGPMATGNLSYVLPAWRVNKSTCLGSNLSVLDIVRLINNGMVCPQ